MVSFFDIPFLHKLVPPGHPVPPGNVTVTKVKDRKGVAVEDMDNLRTLFIKPTKTGSQKCHFGDKEPFMYLL